MYIKLSKEIENRIIDDRKNSKVNPYAFKDEDAIRERDDKNDEPSVIRSNFIRDVDKILHCPFFSRYQDKTQVFSLFKNDDITRRSMHVQFVSRIARTIGKALNLNLELIEAIALGHDIGHTPFGHAGESILDKIMFSKTSRHFYHNLHSVRVLNTIFPLNITLHTLDGVLCHNGELELDEYKPAKLDNFTDFNACAEKCYTNTGYVSTLTPCTLEGCVVRIADIIAYLGKDRQDAVLTNTAIDNDFSNGKIGLFNAEIINNITINIVENSYMKPYIKMEKSFFEDLKKAKRENYEKIYFSKTAQGQIDNLQPMMEKMFDVFLKDLKNGNRNSYIFRHHIDYIDKPYYKRTLPYMQSDFNQIVVDYIASMTDDYFIDLFDTLFPNSTFSLKYKNYFN